MPCVIEGCAQPVTTSVLLPPLTGRYKAVLGPWSVEACDEHADRLMSGEHYFETAEGAIRFGMPDGR